MWAEAKAAMLAILEAIEVADPRDEEAALLTFEVFGAPPASFEGDIAIIMFPPAMTAQRVAMRVDKTYTCRLVLYAKSEYSDFAADVLDAFREAIYDAFTVAVKLNNAADVQRIAGPIFDGGQGRRYGDVDYLTYEFFIDVLILQTTPEVGT